MKIKTKQHLSRINARSIPAFGCNKLKKLWVGGLVLLLSLGSLTPSYGQVKVDAETNEKIQAAGDAAKYIPKVGPFLSFATKLIFRTKKGKSYAEMKAEWEGYTDKKILKKRREDLSSLLKGYTTKVNEINDFEVLEADAKRQVAKNASDNLKTDYHEDKIENWKFIVNDIGVNLEQFKSLKDEPAAPLLPMFAAVANLRINAFDQLIVLSREFDPPAMAGYRSRRYCLMNSYNALINEQIRKAAKERATQVKVARLKGSRFRGGGRGAAMAGAATGYEYYVADQGRRVSNNFQWRSKAEEERSRKARQAQDNFWTYSSKTYLIKKTVVMRINNIDLSVTEDQFHKLFERFGPVHRLGLIYGKINRKKESGKEYKMRGRSLYHDPNVPPDRRQKWNYLRPGWRFEGIAYVEMEQAFATVALEYWSSPRGQEKARDDTGSRFNVQDFGHPWFTRHGTKIESGKGTPANVVTALPFHGLVCAQFESNRVIP